MSFNFPINPSLNQTYSVGDKTWIYDGRGWKLSTLQFSVVPIYNHANGAYDKANSANSLAQAAFNAANNAGSSAQIQTISTHANGAFDKANSANVLAQAAFNTANTDVTSISTTAGTYGSTTVVPVISIVANGRVLSISNTAIEFPVTSVAGATGAVSNTQLLDGIETVDGAGSGLDADLLDGLQGSSYANSTFTQSAFDQANSANVLAQNAYNFANTRYSSSGGTISGDVQISGNLIVVGNTVTYSANNVVVNDPILLIANNNPANLLDIGFSGHYVESTVLKHTGLIRDVSTSTWYLFEGYEPDIQGANVLNIAHPTLVVSNLKANVFGNANTATTWQTARTVTIGSTGKSVDGSANVTWTLSEIGAQTAGSYVTTGDAQTITGVKTFANNFIINSNTLVANLNASLLNGLPSTWFANATVANTDVTSISTTAGVYGNNTIVPVITLEANGRVRSITNTSISFPAETDTLQSVTARGNTSDRVITLTNTSKTTSNTTGSLIVSGGIAVTGNVALQQIFFADGTSMNTAASGTGGGASITWTRKTANYTAVNGDRIIADTSGGSFVITLPATPSLGDVIVIADGNNWQTNTLNVARNGATIEGFSEDLQLDIPGIRVDLVYDGTTWEAYTFATPQASVINDTTTNTTQYINMVRNITGALQNTYVSSTNFYFNPLSGAVSATDFNSLSDATLKENISSITNAIDILDAIRPVEFNWKNNGKKSYGVLAQEIEQILPQVVETNKDNNIKSVSYTQLVPILIESIKELKREIQILKEEKK